MPIIAFHLVTEYGPETPDPFSPATLPATPINMGKSIWLARLHMHMISLTTRSLAWGGRVWARAYIWVVPR